MYIVKLGCPLVELIKNRGLLRVSFREDFVLSVTFLNEIEIQI
jgi:hypothetical protein